MAKIAGVPVKTRLPIVAWVFAGLVAALSMLTSVVAPTSDHALAAKDRSTYVAQMVR